MNFFSILFSFSGTISRKNYWISLTGVFITTMTVLVILAKYFPEGGIVPVIPSLIGLVSYISIQVKRCNDIGWHPGFVLLSFIPYFFLIWLLILGIFEYSKTITSAIDNIKETYTSAIDNIKEKYSNISKASKQENNKSEEKETIIYCSNCGSKLKENITVCSDCGFQPQSEKNYCYHCGVEVNEKQIMCIKCGIELPTNRTADKAVSWQHKTTAGLLGILLGGLGIHKFYHGSWGWGILYILLVWTLIPSLVGFVEGIIFLVMNETNYENKYANKKRWAFKW